MGNYSYEQSLMSPDNPLPFWVDYQERTGPGLMCSAHYHEAIELIYSYTGGCEIVLGGQKLTFGPGDLLFLNSCDVHTIRGLDERTEYLMIQFDPSLFYTGSLGSFEMKYLLPFTLTSSEYQNIFTAAELSGLGMAALAENILTESKKKDYGYELSICTDLSRIFLWILRTLKKRGVDYSVGKMISETDANRVVAAMDLARENYKSGISASDAAKACNVSYSYFSRLFKSITKRNFTDYVNFLRINEAEKLLTETDMSVTDISYEVGFSSSSYFISHFRGAKGISPMKYRKSFGITK